MPTNLAAAVGWVLVGYLCGAIPFVPALEDGEQDAPIRAARAAGPANLKSPRSDWWSYTPPSTVAHLSTT